MCIRDSASAETMAKIVDMMDREGVYWQIGELGAVDVGGGGTVAMYEACLLYTSCRRQIMKKKLIAAIVLAAAMGLGGCSGSGRTSGTGTTEAVETTQAETAQTTAEETEKDTALTADDKEKQLETEYKADVYKRQVC